MPSRIDARLRRLEVLVKGSGREVTLTLLIMAASGDEEATRLIKTCNPESTLFHLIAHAASSERRIRYGVH